MMFTKVSVLVPTRQRLDRLRTMLASFHTTSSGAAELVFRVDDDDVPTQTLLTDYHQIIGPRRGYGGLPEMLNELYAASSGDVLMCGNDDVVFKTPGWDAIILEWANRYPDAVFDFGVKTHNEANFPLATVSRRIADRVGFFFPPDLFWGDIFWRDVTSHFGRAIPLPEVEIDHDWVGFKPDQVFIDGEKVRRANHMALHEASVNDAIEKLQGLINA